MDLAPLLPQIITAVATLGGVVLTLIFTGRRESKRMEQQLAFEREKLLADERRQVFTRTAHALQRMREVLNDRDDVVSEYGEDVWHEFVTKRADELFMLETELLLLAPDLAGHVRDATNTARAIRDNAAGPQEAADQLITRYRSAVRNAMEDMRKFMGTSTASPRDVTPRDRQPRITT